MVAGQPLQARPPLNAHVVRGEPMAHASRSGTGGDARSVSCLPPRARLERPAPVERNSLTSSWSHIPCVSSLPEYISVRSAGIPR